MTDVLLAIDESKERALAQVETVLDLFAVESIHAHLFHDFVENPEGASVTQIQSVRRAADRLEDAGVEVTYHEESGDPSDTIIDTADDIDADAIVMSGRKRSPAGKVLFGSVTQAVILSTDRPVLLCDPRHNR